MNNAASERRRFQRIAFDASAKIIQGRHTWPVKLHDISFKGLLTDRPLNWANDSDPRYLVRIELDRTIQVTMQVELAHSTEQMLGFICCHIDLDSMCHLRRLMEFNLADEQLLERELSALYQDTPPPPCGISPRRSAGTP
jgi:hypothetical protein